MSWRCRDLAASEIRGAVRNQINQGNAEHLRKREHRAQRRIRRISRARLSLFILLIGVPRKARPIGDIFLAQPGTLACGTERGREALGVRAPLRFNLIVPSGHLPSVSTTSSSYGLIGMA